MLAPRDAQCPWARNESCFELANSSWTPILHPPARFDVRATSAATRRLGFGIQCTYDARGQLITDGSGAPSIDLGPPADSLFAHHVCDVAGFNLVNEAGGSNEQSRYDAEHPTPGQICDAGYGPADHPRLRLDAVPLDPRRLALDVALRLGAHALPERAKGGGSVHIDIALRIYDVSVGAYLGLSSEAGTAHAMVRTAGGVGLRWFVDARTVRTRLPLHPETWIGVSLGIAGTSEGSFGPSAGVESGTRIYVLPWLGVGLLAGVHIQDAVRAGGALEIVLSEY